MLAGCAPKTDAALDGCPKTEPAEFWVCPKGVVVAVGFPNIVED